MTTSCAAVTQCTATGASSAWRSAIHAVRLSKVEIGVVQNPLAGGQAVHALTQFAVAVGLHQFDDIADFQVRGGVGDAGDPVRTEPPADFGKPAVVALQGIRPAVVGAAQPTVGVIGEPDPCQPG